MIVGLVGCARPILLEVPKMFAYLCRKCGSCSSEFILEQMEDPGSGHSGSSASPFISNICPGCQSLFSAESYFVLQSAEQLMQRTEMVFRGRG
jgi:hypothetical protein